MRINVFIENVYHEDLVSVFSKTAMFGVSIPKHWSFLVESKSYPGRTTVDKSADVILYGGYVDAASALPSERRASGVIGLVNDKGEAIYRFGLTAILNGLKSAFLSKDGRVRRAIEHLAFEPNLFSCGDADILMQMIIFGEVLYR